MRGLDRRAWAVALVFLLFVGARTSVTTYLAIFLVRDRSLDAPVVGAALLTENLIRALLGPALGAVSDRYGRRSVLFAGAVASLAIGPAFLLVRDVPTLFIWAALFGTVQSPFFPVGLSLLLDLVPPERHQTVLALNLSTLNVGYMLAMAPAGFIAQLGWGWLGVWAAAQFMLVGVIVATLLRGPLPREQRPQRGILVSSLAPFRDATFVWLSAVTFAFPFALGLIGSVIPLYAAEVGWQPGAIGLFLALNGAVVALFSLPVNVVLQRLGPFRPLPAAALLAASAELTLRDHGAMALGVAVVVVGLAEVVFAAALPAAIAALAPPGARGAYQGAASLVQSVGWGLPLVVAGVIRDAVGWQATWTILGIATVLAAGAIVRSIEPLARRAAGVARSELPA